MTEMTRRDRDDLGKLARKRATVAKRNTKAREKELIAELESQLNAIYTPDDDAAWREAYKTAVQEVTGALELADAKVAERARQLGIPERLRPRIGTRTSWAVGGEQLLPARRAELRKIGRARIEAMAEEARHAIDAASLEVETELLAGGLETDQARRFLESMPTPEQLMPAIDARQIQAELETGQSVEQRAEKLRVRERSDQYALDTGRESRPLSHQNAELARAALRERNDAQ